MQNSQIQQGTQSSSQNQVISDEAKETLKEFIDQVKSEIDQVNIENPRKEIIKSDLLEIENSLSDGSGDKNYFLKKLSSVKAILEGAAGNLLADGIASKIPDLMALISAG